jgi:hypothetical protein
MNRPLFALVMIAGALRGAPALSQAWQVSNNTGPMMTDLDTVVQELGPIDRTGRDWIISQMDTLEDRLREVRQNLANRPVPPARLGWHQVYGEECSAYCAYVGQRSGVSTEGSSCTSGENVMATATANVQFIYGCWPNCSPKTVPASSDGASCYTAGQKRDGDWTDVTVGCFCQ